MSTTLDHGIFTISLDFEIHWGVSEHRTIASYRENLKNVPVVIERLLDCFNRQEIHASWATVGMLMCKDKGELIACVSENNQPAYINKQLSNYRLVSEIGNNEKEDPYHFANTLIGKIKNTIGQEIGTHTFSHYYSLERGQTIENFIADLDASIKIHANHHLNIDSIVFPRNQYDENHLDVLNQKGINTYRGNESHWMYAPRSREKETMIRKLARLIDAYIKISGDNTHHISTHTPINIPSSRFLRPYSPKVKWLEKLRLRRIKNEMLYAAQQKKVYHLWWHPHNFGSYTDENFNFLQQILDHYRELNKRYHFQSMNMSEIGKYVSSDES